MTELPAVSELGVLCPAVNHQDICSSGLAHCLVFPFSMLPAVSVELEPAHPACLTLPRPANDILSIPGTKFGQL